MNILKLDYPKETSDVYKSVHSLSPVLSLSHEDSNHHEFCDSLVSLFYCTHACTL